MNCEQAQNIDIVGYLRYRGHHPVKETVRDIWFKSPFRDETTASFQVYKNNRFNDWGSGQFGDIIKLVRILHNVNTAAALKILNEYQPSETTSDPFSFNKQKKSSSVNIGHRKGPDIIKVAAITNDHIIKYLNKRSIPEQVWKNCDKLHEYSYSYKNNVNGTIYYNLAFINDRGGYELSNFGFKGCLRKKAITTIPGSKLEINVFEGFFDYLSALAYFSKDKLTGTTIILNTLTLLDSIIPQLSDYEIINLFLDNDLPGIESSEKITNCFQNVVNYSMLIYPDHKDFNEFMVKNVNG